MPDHVLTRALGGVLAQGTRASVHLYGDEAVIKIPEASTPEEWILLEAEYGAAVRDAGAPAARLLGVELVGGRAASVWERVPGPTMWQSALQDRSRCEEHGATLADLQLILFDLVPPVSLPRQQDRMTSKIRRSAALLGASLGQAADELLPSRPPRICHGDLHPGNVILSDAGPVIVDWFDVSRGNPLADIARSSLLIDVGDGVSLPRHLPGADAGMLAALASGHLDRLRSRMHVPAEELERWRAVGAVARLAEDVPPAPLLAEWRRFSRRAAST